MICYNSHMKTYAQALKIHNLKVTPQRLAITGALSEYGHLAIERMYELLQERFPTISLATIYKNVHIMMDANYIQEVKLPRAKSVYELTKETHSHLMCSACGTIEDLSIDFADVASIAASKTSFKIEQADLVFSGICKNCQ